MFLDTIICFVTNQTCFVTKQTVLPRIKPVLSRSKLFCHESNLICHKANCFVTKQTVLPRSKPDLSQSKLFCHEANCFATKQTCFATKQTCFVMKQSCCDENIFFRLRSCSLDGKTAVFAVRTRICRVQMLFRGADRPAAPMIRISPLQRKLPATRRRLSFYHPTHKLQRLIRNHRG
jgi:hypothetical protein